MGIHTKTRLSASARAGHNGRMTTISEIPLTTIDGQPTSLSAYAGEVLLIVNVASKCGLTPQYTALEALYQQFKDQGFTVLGFPANDFAGQEPGTNAEIAAFCTTEYPVTFPLFSKISVTGDAKHALYRALTSTQPDRISNGNDLHDHLAEYARQNGLPGPNKLPEVLWNFEKFLVSRQGEVVARFAPDLTPDDPKLIEAIESALSRS